MKQIIRLCAAITAAALYSGCAAEPTGSVSSPLLTTDDVDCAVECTGILGYINWVSESDLDIYLPNSVAAAIVARRAQAPFTSIADISSVPGIAQARLEWIAGGARTDDWIDEDCAGVFDELAVSHDDQTAILAFVNAASATDLAAALRFRPSEIAAELIAERPITSLAQLADSYGVGPASFRAIRNAATH